MCFRYVGVDPRKARPEELRDRYREVEMPGDRLRELYAGDMGVFVAHGGEVMEGRWGLQPPWAEDPNFGKRNAYNARAETIAEKPTFRSAYRHRRCVVPAAAFYERGEGHWLRVSPADDDGFLIAGLYELGETPSYTMVTTEANAAVADVNDRMPVILRTAEAEVWMSPEANLRELPALLLPCPVEWLRVENGGPVVARRKAAGPSLFEGE